MQKVKMFNCIFYIITIIIIIIIQSIVTHQSSENYINKHNIIRYKRASHRIIGGVNAERGKYPFMVSIRNHMGGYHSCGGFILKSNFIVTAAHCLMHQHANNLEVYTGSHLLNPGGVSHTVESINPHSNFSQNMIQQDIGLIKLTANIEFNDLTKPIEIGMDELAPESEVTLIGWGLTKLNRLEITNRLQEIELKIVPLDECAAVMKWLKPITDKQMCTFTHFDQGACFGDSGGPLIQNDKVYGIVSWGYPCGRGYPDIFTKLSSYNDWIDDAMASM